MDVIPFFIGLGVGLGCLVAALVVVLRSMKPFQQRAANIRTRLSAVNLDQARRDTERLAHAAERIAALRARVANRL